MYEITKEFHFSAAHSLPTLPDGHKCKRLHGHNYIVVVVLRWQGLNEHGFVVDYGDLEPLKRYIDDELDHRNLNDILTVPTTAENIAQHLFQFCKGHWPQTRQVRVSETPKTWASYTDCPHNL